MCQLERTVQSPAVQPSTETRTTQTSDIEVTYRTVRTQTLWQAPAVATKLTQTERREEAVTKPFDRRVRDQRVTQHSAAVQTDKLITKQNT